MSGLPSRLPGVAPSPFARDLSSPIRRSMVTPKKLGDAFEMSFAGCALAAFPRTPLLWQDAESLGALLSTAAAGKALHAEFANVPGDVFAQCAGDDSHAASSRAVENASHSKGWAEKRGAAATVPTRGRQTPTRYENTTTPLDGGASHSRKCLVVYLRKAQRIWRTLVGTIEILTQKYIAVTSLYKFTRYAPGYGKAIPSTPYAAAKRHENKVKTQETDP